MGVTSQMTGFFAETIGELFTGKGAVGQLSLETLVPRPVIAAVILGVVVFNFATALNPAGECHYLYLLNFAICTWLSLQLQ